MYLVDRKATLTLIDHYFSRWLLINTTDPMGQLSWLMNVLQKAEDNKEKVKRICDASYKYQ